ncbi:hypothetical protein R1sor_005029 [Riccia sorocarpa]|uniref:Uncharacterized protein n=1 Tax=Riccia sorocarpa TaxID=122646 RepID=A0ABD3HIZ4_9MARC
MVQGQRLLPLAVRTVRLATRQCNEVQIFRELFKDKAVAAKGSSFHGWLPSFSMQVSRSMSCCAKLDLPPPTELTVEYHENPENTDYFIKLADGVEDAHPDIMVMGNPEGVTPRDGAFEVMTGEFVLFSKLKENRLPTLEDILRAIDEMPTQVLSCELEGTEKVVNA